MCLQWSDCLHMICFAVRTVAARPPLLTRCRIPNGFHGLTRGPLALQGHEQHAF